MRSGELIHVGLSDTKVNSTAPLMNFEREEQCMYSIQLLLITDEKNWWRGSWLRVLLFVMRSSCSACYRMCRCPILYPSFLIPYGKQGSCNVLFPHFLLFFLLLMLPLNRAKAKERNSKNLLWEGWWYEWKCIYTRIHTMFLHQESWCNAHPTLFFLHSPLSGASFWWITAGWWWSEGKWRKRLRELSFITTSSSLFDHHHNL